ncbi:MAG: translation elongation factor-like protein [Candidatus Daviesbacteria bacterium]|nr:translation elongation factor-like protein [Candidatus Daviesbacteria bacterium]
MLELLRLGVIFLDNPIGKVVHYYDKLSVAIIDLEKGGLKVGDEVKFKRGDEEFSQKIESLQVDHKDVDSVKKGDSFGVKVDKPTKPGTEVYLV